MEDSKDLRECPYCNGNGYNAAHNSPESHINGECTDCPVQVECNLCRATGSITEEEYSKHIETKKQKIIESSDLPF